MRSPRGAWSLAGLLGGLAGLAASHLVAALLHVRSTPVVAVAELAVRLTPPGLVEWGIEAFGVFDKAVLVLVILVALSAVFAWAGHLGRRSWWLTLLPYGVLAGIGAVAVLVVPGSTPSTDLLPVLAGLLTWVVATALLSVPLRVQDGRAAAGPGAAPARGGSEDGTGDGTEVDAETGLSAPNRRSLLVRMGAVGAVAVLAGLGGEVLARRRQGVERARSLLGLQVTRPTVPPAARIGLEGVTSWETPNPDFYVIHTAFAVPTIDPADWRLRIHGMVDRELVLSFDDLFSGRLTERWTTLNCVSNEIGGDLIGNAWWSGTLTQQVLSLAGVQDGADAVLQTSEDGWTCGTPLEALTDDRQAMLAVAMNGQPLPVEHGFPVRTLVPGLYGYVSACKWVVDWEVTRFDRFSAYWTENGWAEQGPVKMGSRIDVPRSGEELPAGDVIAGGMAWFQHTGISGVEVSLDGGAWTPGEVADSRRIDSWFQWRAVLPDVPTGEHVLRVRALDPDGTPQTGVVADTVPDGATGWHEVDFTVTEG
ncbi:molybdopterin-dependent oxidoreductase [Nocardioides sp. CFH 31398]|uniref:molybdopterin-dependent oxidoreductase n=1 Tax=Nocardioides sp. CFH 31398 TaxID=2919579 RepID=UPI001F06B362|nr:molybdopterin-dependent oxidoreductase [Nocardioides sp. CFH 31398]MCH1865910.1 molybdopterin-dependent oxidoreductase [Nocardioides sp. CFH 31398]